MSRKEEDAFLVESGPCSNFIAALRFLLGACGIGLQRSGFPSTCSPDSSFSFRCLTVRFPVFLLCLDRLCSCFLFSALCSVHVRDCYYSLVSASDACTKSPFFVYGGFGDTFFLRHWLACGNQSRSRPPRRGLGLSTYQRSASIMRMLEA
jgi:hypothetical protein